MLNHHFQHCARPNVKSYLCKHLKWMHIGFMPLQIWNFHVEFLIGKRFKNGIYRVYKSINGFTFFSARTFAPQNILRVRLKLLILYNLSNQILYNAHKQNARDWQKQFKYLFCSLILNRKQINQANCVGSSNNFSYSFLHRMKCEFIHLKWFNFQYY